jgi:hypothetical protein
MLQHPLAHSRVAFVGSQFTTQFTCFTSTKVQILTHAAAPARALARRPFAAACVPPLYLLYYFTTHEHLGRRHTCGYDGDTYASIRQHTAAYVRIRQHTSAYVSIRQHTSAYVSIRRMRLRRRHHSLLLPQHCVSICTVVLVKHTPAYVSIRRMRPRRRHHSLLLPQHVSVFVL